MNSSTGKLLVDDLRVQPIESLPIDRPSTVASDYLQDALEKIRHRAYYSDRVDWVRARSNAFLVASGAQTPYETYDAVRYALRLLGDHHSFLVEPAQVREQAVSTARDFGITGTTLAGIGYIAVPGYNGQNTERSDAFSSAIQEHIAHAQAAQACRWIVDLRNNTGGNMYPMLAGLHPLLGDEPLGYFYNRAGEWHPWSARKGASIAREASNDVVAIITGRETASSGEAVTLSFRGRPHTRSFGEATAGYSTANQSVALSDGAQIALTSGLMADRHRNVANGSIQPDEIVDVPNTVQFKDDPAIRAATAWLRTQPCADSPR